MWGEYMKAITLTEQLVRKEGITKEIGPKLEIEFKDNMPAICCETTNSIKNEMIDFLKIQSESLIVTDFGGATLRLNKSKTY